MQLVAFDIGNTAVTYGIYNDDKLSRHGSSLYADIPKTILKWRKSGLINNESHIIISSVVPKLTHLLKNQFLKSNNKIRVIGGNIKIPIQHHYRSLSRLGADRILNVYGALKLYQPPLLILDFGTALTADFVSKTGVFEGGMIIPGPEIAFQALIERAALLPKKARLPLKSRSYLGKTTYDCMKSGILEGYGSMIDGLAQRFKARFGPGLKILATGGFASVIKFYTKSFDILDPLHSIKALHFIYKDIVLKEG